MLIDQKMTTLHNSWCFKSSKHMTRSLLDAFQPLQTHTFFAVV